MRNVLLLCAALGLSAAEPEAKDKIPGYTNTPIIAGTTWHVHDPARPQPQPVRGSCLATPAPADAKMLFDGKSLEAFNEAKWTLENGVMIAGKSDLTSKESFGSCQLHLEFMIPKSCCKGNQSGNSGIFLMGLYELQVLNGWESLTYADGTLGAVYGQTPPLVKASNPPDEWNSYDIAFTAPVFDAEGKLVSPAKVTAIVNGIVVQNGTSILGPTRHKETRPYKAHEAKLPLRLQFHGDPVHYRNVWIRELAK